MSHRARSRNRIRSRCGKCGVKSTDMVGTVSWCPSCGHVAERVPTGRGNRVPYFSRKLTDKEVFGAAGGNR